MKKNQPGVKYIWRFHRELSPTRVISIRGTEGYLAPEDPKIGNRMIVHALVRIDSEQVRSFVRSRWVSNNEYSCATEFGDVRRVGKTTSSSSNRD
jgi:hypothetical protein